MTNDQATPEQIKAMTELFKAMEHVDVFSMFDKDKLLAEYIRLKPESDRLSRFLGLIP